VGFARGLVVLGVALVVALLAASSAAAAACGWNPVCPYQAATVFGDTDPASLDGPLAIALTPSGDAVIADQAKESVREFDATGQLVREIGTPGSYNNVNGVAVDESSGEIWVSDYMGVTGLASDGTPEVQIQTYAPDGVPPASFHPAGIAVGPSGTLYVYDGQASSIAAYSPAGVLEATWPVPTPPGDEGESATLAVDSAGNVYVGFVDLYSSIEKFSSAGTLLGTLAPDSVPTTIAIYGSTLYVESDTGFDTYDLAGNHTQLIADPGLASDPYGLSPLFAVGATGIDAITAGHSIQHLGLDGTPARSWGTLANDDFVAGQVLADGSGDIYVLDTANGRIIRYDAQGDPPIVFADVPGATTAQFDSAGRLVVENGPTLTTLDQTGSVASTVQLACTYCGSSFAFDPASGDIYVAGFYDLEKYTPTGTLLAEWAIPAENVATDSAGNVYVDSFSGSAAVPGNYIGKYSPAGQLIGKVGVDVGWDPGMPGAIAVDPQGRIYTTTGYDIRAFDPAGTMVAVWPYSAGPLTVDGGGDVYVGSGATVTRFSDFLDPLPPMPPMSSSPFVQAMEAALRFSGALQLHSSGIDTTVSCTGSAGVSCEGELVLSTMTNVRIAHSKRVKHKVTILGTRAFSIPAGERKAEKVGLDTAARRLLTTHAKLAATMTASYRAGTNTSTVSRKVVLRGHKPKRK
jgi:sugar lactone lactonase YvrE